VYKELYDASAFQSIKL